VSGTTAAFGSSALELIKAIKSIASSANAVFIMVNLFRRREENSDLRANTEIKSVIPSVSTMSGLTSTTKRRNDELKRNGYARIALMAPQGVGGESGPPP
jgi:hypothetical protein